MCTRVFGVAGHENNAKMAIEDCADDFGECPPKERTGKRIKELLRAALKWLFAAIKSKLDRSNYELVRAASL